MTEMTESQILLFCPLCHRYVAASLRCSCNWQRPLSRAISAPGEPLWRTSLLTSLRSELSVAGNAAFVGGANKILQAISISDGALLWQQDVGAAIRNKPVVEEQQVVVGTQRGTVSACATSNGRESWCYSTGAPGIGDLCITDGVVYIGDALGRLHALDVRSGHPVWTQPFVARKRIGAAPVVGRGLVVVGSYDGYVYAVDKSRGIKVWKRDLGDRITAAPVLTEHWVFVGAHNGQVVKLDLFAGRVQKRWSFVAGGPVLSDLVLNQDGQVLYAGSSDGNLYAIDVQTAAERYRFQAGAAVAAAPARWEGLLFVGAVDGHVYALDADSGEELWRFDAGSPIMGLAVVEGVVYVTTQDGAVFALPWHLGQWQRMAQYTESAGRYGEAASFYALSGRLLEARRLFHRLGDFAAAARVLEAANERTEAAEDYRRAAEQAQKRGESEVAAEFYEQAADLFAWIRSDGEAKTCRDEAIRCRRAPFLQTESLNQPDLVVGEAAVFQFQLTNVGYSKARDVQARLSGQASCVYEFSAPEMAPGYACQVSFENIKPTQAGRDQLFRLLISYRAPDGRSYDYQLPLRLSVRAPKQPPIHADELIVVQGTMIRTHDIGMLKMEDGQADFIAVEGDVGAIVSRSRERKSLDS